MSTIERAKERVLDACIHPYDKQIITDLLAEVEQLNKNIEKVRKIGKRALDDLPARWQQGYKAGIQAAVPYEKEITDALLAEREARKTDNADLTQQVLELEQKVDRLERENKALLEELFTDHLTEAIQQGKEMATENMKLVKENKRYREALERIANSINWWHTSNEPGGPYTAWRGEGEPDDIAEAALEGGYNG